LPGASTDPAIAPVQRATDMCVGRAAAAAPATGHVLRQTALPPGAGTARRSRGRRPGRSLPHGAHLVFKITPGRTGRDRVSSSDPACRRAGLFTATSRYRPIRTRWARPRAAVSSLLVIRTERAAWAWRASMQTPGRPIRRSACHSQRDMAPVSKPTRQARGAFLPGSAAKAPGSEATRP